MKGNHFIITIGRQLGSGGKLIGAELAKQLNIRCYDKELIQLASQESGLSKEFFEQVDEKKRFSFFDNFLGLRHNCLGDSLSQNYLCSESLFKIQSDVIQEIAQKESCVFVGRCADYILREHPNMFSVFITAEEKDRIDRLAQKENISKSDAKELIEQTDKNRANYYNYYSNKIWGVASTYDLCINSSLLGIDETVSLIKEVVAKKFLTTTF